MDYFISDLEPILNCTRSDNESYTATWPRREHINAYHFLSDGVVCSLQIAEHLSHNLLGVASIAHRIQQICRPLSDTHIPLRLGQRQQYKLQWS